MPDYRNDRQSFDDQAQVAFDYGVPLDPSPRNPKPQVRSESYSGARNSTSQDYGEQDPLLPRSRAAYPASHASGRAAGHASGRATAPAAGRAGGHASGRIPYNAQYSYRAAGGASERAPRVTPAATASGAAPDAFQTYAYRNISEAASAPRPQLLKSLLIILAVVLAVAALVFGGIKLFELLSQEPVMLEQGQTVSVSIPEGSTTSQIAKILKRAGLISDELAFKIAVLNREADTLLQPGRYTLVGGTNLEDLITTLINGLDAAFDGFTLTIPEGWTIEQTAARVQNVCGIPAEEFIALAYSADKYVQSYPFLQGVYNNSLEGFLYPKTYLIPRAATADTVIRKLLDQFAIEVVNKVDMSYAASRNLTFFDVITIASLIERETADFEERPLVSSVIYNRLRYGWLLQIDATVVYALGASYDGHPLLYVDLEIDSPYNTYKVPQLPAGPICSPHVSSIEAAAHPEDTAYFYYVLASLDGKHTFCKNEAEFEAAKAAYRRLLG